MSRLEDIVLTGVEYKSGLYGIDPNTNLIVVMQQDHFKIHAAKNYDVIEVVDLAINNVRDIRITTPDSAVIAHFVFGVNPESETEYYLYEDVEIVTAGTAITPINNDRNSANTTVITVDFIDNASVGDANSDTTIAGAVTLKHGIIGSGKDGGEKTHSRETPLKANTVYCLRMIANTAGYVNYDLSWYEHEDIN